MTTLITEFLLVTVGTFLLTAVLLRIIIPILKAHKLGQKILDIGPIWHQKTKEGTPTMGGVGFIIGMLGVLLIVTVVSAIRGTVGELAPLALTLALGVANGMIGFFDDYRKLVKKQNEGLKWYQKLSLQIIVAILYIVAMKLTGSISTELYIPFWGKTFDIGYFYYPFALVLIVGIVNSVNLTDGIDGLASSITVLVSAFYAVLAFWHRDRALELMSASTIGGALGFLVFNFYPAKVFMGDTGSLFFGGMVSAVGIVTEHPLLVLISCGVFVIEAASVILQVFYFKISHGKRLFRMAPLHHHFEKCGWSEWRVVAVFSAVGALFSAVSFLGR